MCTLNLLILLPLILIQILIHQTSCLEMVKLVKYHTTMLFGSACITRVKQNYTFCSTKTLNFYQKPGI